MRTLMTALALVLLAGCGTTTEPTADEIAAVEAANRADGGEAEDAADVGGGSMSVLDVCRELIVPQGPVEEWGGEGTIEERAERGEIGQKFYQRLGEQAEDPVQSKALLAYAAQLRRGITGTDPNTGRDPKREVVDACWKDPVIEQEYQEALDKLGQWIEENPEAFDNGDVEQDMQDDAAVAEEPEEEQGSSRRTEDVFHSLHKFTCAQLLNESEQTLAELEDAVLDPTLVESCQEEPDEIVTDVMVAKFDQDAWLARVAENDDWRAAPSRARDLMLNPGILCRDALKRPTDALDGVEDVWGLVDMWDACRENPDWTLHEVALLKYGVNYGQADLQDE